MGGEGGSEAMREARGERGVGRRRDGRRGAGRGGAGGSHGERDIALRGAHVVRRLELGVEPGRVHELVRMLRTEEHRRIRWGLLN